MLLERQSEIKKGRTMGRDARKSFEFAHDRLISLCVKEKTGIKLEENVVERAAIAVIVTASRLGRSERRH